MRQALVLAVALLAGAVQAEWADVFDIPSGYNRMARPNKGGKPEEVRVTIEIPYLYQVVEDERYVELNLLLIQSWKDERTLGMQYQGIVEENEIGYPLWTPDLVLINQKGEYEVTSKSMRLAYRNEGEVTMYVRMYAKICMELDPWAYPFDYQGFNVTINSFAYDGQEVVLVPVDRKSEIEETVKFGVESSYLTAYNSPTGKHAATKHVELYRKRAGPCMMVLSPVYLIVMFCLGGLFIDEDQYSDRLTQAAIGFLTLMGYTYTVDAYIPTTGEILWIHWFVIISMIFSVLVFAHCVFTHWALTEIARRSKKYKKMAMVSDGHTNKKKSSREAKAAGCLTETFILAMDDWSVWVYPIFYNLIAAAMVCWVLLEADADKGDN